MVAKTETAALASAEKRRLSASYSDEATQHTKRACRTPLLQPDATENHPSPLTEWLDMALDTWVTNDATISLECPSSGLAIDEAPISYTDWQNSDACNANFDTSGYGERSPSGFNISSHNPQFDTTCSTIGQFGCDTEIVTGLNEADRVFWDDWSQPAVMDVSYEPENHRSSEALPNIHPTAANLPLALKSHLNSDDLKKNDTAENIQLEKPDTYSDTCFGVIYTNVTTSFTRKQDTTSVPVRIEPSANFLKFYFQDSNKYAGLITLPVLNKLLMDFDTKLDATLNRPQPTQTTGSRKKDQKTDEYRPNSESSLRIVVKGTMKEASNIGKLLSDAGFYLQHPSADDCDMDVEYFNPHYLVRPGSHMPRLGELDISSNDAATTPAGALDETSKSRLMRIFDSAGDDNILPTTAPSPRLRSTLKRHQLTALAMMSERECGLVEAPQFPLIWEKSTLPDGTATVVFSYWTKMLDLIEKALHSQGYSCQRVDGRMNLRDRATAILQFAEDPSCTVMLATISSAGEGIDLTAANFVHVIEPHWNPMVEAQAIARVHRIGQPYSVVATKYVTRNSVEEYVRWIQEDKLRLVAQSLNSDICQKEIDAERWKKLKLFLGRPDNS
ncbi:uncharacterized protein CTRU02_205155 [Colletotrichum truncatum]|uniref:Uncharacterized protein n=1 Tax=Colletotrichum truncatum TaxID=5467 RepID=A0ACC3Z3A3_COLTU|nr:uncharacterized protein CTRU02_06023 [Colletotrichum truncatum]KAF6793151.1 hypothetical protein CTRU02_06023 [Colletotrichum truncatum]